MTLCRSKREVGDADTHTLKRQLAGERHLMFRAADEAAVRRALRELGYVLPPP